MKKSIVDVKRLAPILIFILIWELAARLELVNNLFIPPFSEVLKTLWSLTSTGFLPRHVLLSLSRALGGFFAAIVLSIPLGLLLSGLSRKIQLAVEPVLEVLCQVNPFICYHLIVLFLGYGEATKVTMISWTCAWPVIFSTASGVKNMDTELLKAAKSLNAKGLNMVIKVLVPAALPSIFTGMRLSAGYSLFMLIAAEMMGASSGLGWLVINSQENYSITTIFAAVTMITILGLLLDLLMERLEEKFSKNERVIKENL